MSVDTSSATIAAGVDSLRARVTGAIKQAASSTGASFEYLLATAKMESDFNPSAGASTSSARGLYQFIEQTWLATVKEAGGQLGYSQYADAVTKTSSGDYAVVDPTMRRAIMKLRDDPSIRMVETYDHTVTAEFEGVDEDMARLLGRLIHAGIVVQSFSEEPLSLEEVFMMITKGIVS